jgi:hypothetical protein
MKGGCIYTHGGREYWLVCTADAYFDIVDAFGEGFGDKLLSGGREGFETAIGCLCILAREGELCRRYMGHTPADIPEEAEIRRIILPGDIGKIKGLVIDAVAAGLRMPGAEKEEGPVDLGLAEFEKKTMITHRKR